ncbi:hypothetical protein [Streptomyces sp. NPDC005573]|uniref:hypothetical protein n=1 Tax=unclassified Streptomyces TaxID=2593676 RepID=UPI0033AD4461
MQPLSAWWDLGLAIALLPVSAAIVVWHLAHVLLSGDDFGTVGIRTIRAARRGARITGCAAVVVGGTPMCLRLWITGSLQLLVLGTATALFASVAARRGA